MKKLLILSAVCMAMTAQATVLRVSNRTNSGAPYSSISDAISAAEEGDTIMVDGSNTAYSGVTLTKRVVLIGPGFLLSDNSLVAEGSPSAKIPNLSSNYNQAAGSIIMGMDITGPVTLSQPNMVITRCRVGSMISIANSASNIVIHQNYLSGTVYCITNSSYAPGTQITNNIFARANDQKDGIIHNISNGTIAYNTFTKTGNWADYPVNIANLANCTVEHNIFVGSAVTIEGCVIQDNYWSGAADESLLKNCTTDKAVKETTEANISAFSGKGAFAGNDPYVISGIPAGPYISDITVPASVEQGQTLKVNVKLGVQQ
jgi:hypothetical protein